MLAWNTYNSHDLIVILVQTFNRINNNKKESEQTEYLTLATYSIISKSEAFCAENGNEFSLKYYDNNVCK